MPFGIRTVAVVVLTFALFAGGAARCKPKQVCNGAAALCDRSYEDVAYPTSHNAMSNADDGWSLPNQEHGITWQLDNGVRGLMLDAHLNGPAIPTSDVPLGTPLLCHGYCHFGWQHLAEGLGEITTFLDHHPNEVVTIIFESYVSPSVMQTAFEESGLAAYATDHVAGTPWPTLREMIAANDRVVVLTDSGGGAYPWYLPVWAEATENPYSALTSADLSCAPNRGNPANRLFILNNFLTNPYGRRIFADEVNANPFLTDQIERCRAERSDFPNFVTVDFADRGDLLAAVKTLNGV